jgi:hypothetical protein
MHDPIRTFDPSTMPRYPFRRPTMRFEHETRFAVYLSPSSSSRFRSRFTIQFESRTPPPSACRRGPRRASPRRTPDEKSFDWARFPKSSNSLQNSHTSQGNHFSTITLRSFASCSGSSGPDTMLHRSRKQAASLILSRSFMPLVFSVYVDLAKPVANTTCVVNTSRSHTVVHHSVKSRALLRPLHPLRHSAIVHTWRFTHERLMKYPTSQIAKISGAVAVCPGVYAISQTENCTYRAAPDLVDKNAF